ncbi:hypothetical protein [Mycobacterium sp.]|uniref:hypothetical protein n=1 Tax=Mycobacterium sp. TaxID=1785 RepID=UPI003F80EDF8
MGTSRQMFIPRRHEIDELAATAVTGRPNGLVLLRHDRERSMWRWRRFAKSRGTR